jgi:hypothetical protein
MAQEEPRVEKKGVPDKNDIYGRDVVRPPTNCVDLAVPRVLVKGFSELEEQHHSKLDKRDPLIRPPFRESGILERLPLALAPRLGRALGLDFPGLVDRFGTEDPLAEDEEGFEHLKVGRAVGDGGQPAASRRSDRWFGSSVILVKFEDAGI